MKILHTADWHLGQRLAGRDRSEEHRLFLDWLLEEMARTRVDCLIVAGDIFDTVSPSQATMQIYYDFLTRLHRLPGTTAILVGGNHDSPAHLNAPRELLRRLDIHVVGEASADPAQCLIPLGAGPEAVVAAVPYLRERDLRSARPGETFEERDARSREAVGEYYRAALDAAEMYRRRGIPVVATGHLTLAGGTVRSGEDETEIGHLRVIDASGLPEDFDYFALGHLHEPQCAGANAVFRYSGSPYPVNFAEAGREKQVVLIEVEPGSPAAARGIPVPPFRRLLRYAGSLEGVSRWMESLPSPEDGELPAWVEVHLHDPDSGSGADRSVRESAAAWPVEILKVIVEEENLAAAPADGAPANDLENLSPEEVFRERCRTAGMEAGDLETEEVVATFRELLEIWRDSGREAPEPAAPERPPESGSLRRVAN